MNKPKESPKSAPKDARRLARLVAVQALYQADLMGQSAVLVLKEVEAHRLTMRQGQAYLSEVESAEIIGAVDVPLMRDIVALALQHQDQLQEMLAANLPPSWSIDRLERSIRIIMLAGLAEILYQAQTPTAIIVSDYVDVSHAYYGGKEPGFVNAVLDKVAKVVRA